MPSYFENSTNSQYYPGKEQLKHYSTFIYLFLPLFIVSFEFIYFWLFVKMFSVKILQISTF